MFVKHITGMNSLHYLLRDFQEDFPCDFKQFLHILIKTKRKEWINCYPHNPYYIKFSTSVYLYPIKNREIEIAVSNYGNVRGHTQMILNEICKWVVQL